MSAAPSMRRPIRNVSLAGQVIEKAIRDAFLLDPRLANFNPDIVVKNGVVMISGKVDSLCAKKRACETALNTTGVRRVYNYLNVRPGKTMTDERIARMVRAAILRDPFLDRHDIKVSVSNSKVFLYGEVDSRYEKSRAGEVVSRLSQVVAVGNHLVVLKEWTWKDDLELREAIESQLFWSPFVDEDGITVTVEDGVAVLTGTVDSWSERRDAAINAWEGGARRVQNLLSVAGAEKSADS